MNPDYQKYSVEDFTQDELFRRWVILRDPQSEALWADWLAAHPEASGKVQLARAFLYALEEKNTALPEDELANLTEDIIQQDKQRIRPLWTSPMLRIAASILVVLGLGYLFLVHQPGSSRVDKLAEISPVLAANYSEVENNKAEPQDITLQDGSVVTLYTHSKLRYPKQFLPKLREVYLSGQAFFKITKNPKQPFWVHADQISTQVLGTSFMVKTEGNNAKVEVRSGRVSVYTRKDIRAARRLQQNESVGVVLTANQQVDFIEKEDRLVKSIVAQPIVLQKIESRDYVFEEAPIDRVFNQLEKTYGLPVLYDPVTVKNCFITANLADESLFDKLNLICRISRATYEIVDGQIIIHSAGCDNK
ncbi:FecR family protein [Spirosoma foliorum]|uniref:FecR domain-containing protein n=1 Tax=Spirosoma foliorum TaxID=2710596 RepID=A0A7G5H2Y7_9BACT|nr:FecR family protein [Spirosoma foliorum]QMW05479.1 FecR domain-containing protein [Spirosoma foliorum]